MTRLCLSIADDGRSSLDTVLANLRAAFATVPAASLLIAPGAAGALDAERLRPMIELAQARDIAVLLAEDAALAKRLGADGVHLPYADDPAERYEAARRVLGAGHIVGGEAGASRHDAMRLGEAGADYVAFGLSPQGASAAAARRELSAWWAELFEVPVMSLDVASAEEAAELADAGADFIAVTLPADADADATATFLAGIVTALAGGTPS